MAGPQVQRKQDHMQPQRPTSAYYASATETTTTTTNGLATSSSYAGLHALRQISNESELIYRGSNGNTFVSQNDCVVDGSSRDEGMVASTSHIAVNNRKIIREPSKRNTSHRMTVKCENGGRGGGGSNAGAHDALIVPATEIVSTSTTTTMAMPANSYSNAYITQSELSNRTDSSGAHRSNVRQQRSVEIVVDATGCGGSDIEQGQTRKSSHHRRRPLHRRLLNYLRSLFQGSDTTHDSELEDYETPIRYRPDSLSALSRSTKFTQDEIKRIYRGFKAECPTGVVKEDTFKIIYSQFFPQGANPSLYAHYVFNTLDQDHSGNVSFEEFVQGLSILSRGSIDEKLRWTFSLYDINGDGCITREEMTDIVTAIYELMGRLPDEMPTEEKIQHKVEHIFRKMDINCDGVVTLEEFLEACRNDETISRSMSVFDTAF